MSVCVGIDVHRKRSQIAVVDEAGTVLANRNVVNGVEQVLSVIGQYPTHTPGGVRGGVRVGLAGRAARGLRVRTASAAPVAVQGDRVGSVEAAQVAGDDAALTVAAVAPGSGQPQLSELPTRGDAEFAEDATQVGFDRSRAEKELRGDFA